MKRKDLDLNDYIDGIKDGDIAILSRAISLVESKKTEHQKLAKELIKSIYPRTGKAKRIGISGTPGVGKSTFIESFGTFLTDLGLKVAVLAIDPTSYKTGGSILGDKTRMNKLASDKNAFVRPSPSGMTLGGVANKTRESMLLCEAAGYDIVIIETVGVGQSEVAVSKVVDFFLLLMQSGGGDDLQGIKRGILELADLVAVNKADGDGKMIADVARREYETAVHILRSSEEWEPKVLACSGLNGTGLTDIWDNINEYYTKMAKDNKLINKREEQVHKWFYELLLEKIRNEINTNKSIQQNIESSYKKILKHETTLLDAVDDLYKDIME
jgi:LAO/AO transport system kinase